MTTKWILAPCFVAAIAAGCQQQTRVVDASNGAAREVVAAPELVACSRPPIPDLPMPIGFDLDESASRDFAAAGARYVDHVYRGGDDKFAVARFFKRQMPVSRWVLVTSLFVQGDVMLDFEKETERCRIVITDGRFSSTQVNVQLWTSGQLQTASRTPQ